MRKGQFVNRSNDGMVFVKLRDTKEVCFLSTMHRADVTASGKCDRQGRAISKLSLVQDYNRFMDMNRLRKIGQKKRKKIGLSEVGF